MSSTNILQRIEALSPEQAAKLRQQLQQKGISMEQLVRSLKQSPAAAAPSPAPAAPQARPTPQAQSAPQPASQSSQEKALKFSLFFFSEDESQLGANKYELLIEGAKAADRAGFHAVYTPERHFHPFGGLYPSPATLSAALAMVTERLRIRAGSVVLPLQDPIRVAEEFAIVDNLSKGRVGLSFASGWQPNDFVLAPGNYARRKEVMFEGIETLRKLWRGERVKRPGPNGEQIEVQIFPRPVQAEVPIWVTSAVNPATWLRAAEIGANVLTGLLEQNVEALIKNIALYRKALASHGFDPQSREVTLMMHTFIGEELEQVRETVRGPMCAYLRTHLSLYTDLVKNRDSVDVDSFSEDDKDALVALGFERYFNTSALLGTPASCTPMIERLRGAGVDEIACLVDFGLDVKTILGGLEHLSRLRDRVNAPQPAVTKA